MTNDIALTASQEGVLLEIQKMITKKLAKEKWIPSSMHEHMLKVARKSYLEYCKAAPDPRSAAQSPRQAAIAFFKILSKQSPQLSEEK